MSTSSSAAAKNRLRLAVLLGCSASRASSFVPTSRTSAAMALRPRKQMTVGGRYGASGGPLGAEQQQQQGLPSEFDAKDDLVVATDDIIAIVANDTAGALSGGNSGDILSLIHEAAAPPTAAVVENPELLVETLIEPAIVGAASAATSGGPPAEDVEVDATSGQDFTPPPAVTAAAMSYVVVDSSVDNDVDGGKEAEAPLTEQQQIEEHPPVLSDEGLAHVQQLESAEVHAPTVSKIIKFAIPAMGVWLCGPILSMIDTSAVGLLAGTAQQAALNPAVAVTDYGGLLVAFMYTATTNLVAAAQESDRGVEGKPRTAKALTTALQLGLFVGIGFGTVLFTLSRQLLRALIGNDAMDPVVFAAAMKYVRIRSLGMPAAVVIGSAQSACLGMQDIRSPLYVLLAAAVVNAVGDAIFVGSSNPLIGGAAGAAWATVFSQYAALTLFVAWLKTEPRRRKERAEKERADEATAPTTQTQTVDITDAIMELTTKSEEGKGRRRRFRNALKSVVRKKSPTPKQQTTAAPPPSRGFLAGRFRGRDIFKLPPLASAKDFWFYVVPVTTTAIGRISGYIAMSHVCSSTLGTVDMAAQAIIFAMFCVLTPVCDSLNLTAQSFVPSIFEKKKSKARALALRQTLNNFSKVGAAFGAVLVALVASIPLFCKYFTTDPAVFGSVNAAIPGLATFFSLSGLVCVGEGMLLGQKDLKFLGNAYGAYFFAVPYFLLRLKRRALLGLQTVGLGTMWETFCIYQVIRCSIWYARMKQLERRAEREVSDEEVQLATA